jgi:hypothetical protein
MRAVTPGDKTTLTGDGILDAVCRDIGVVEQPDTNSSMATIGNAKNFMTPLLTLRRFQNEV